MTAPASYVFSQVTRAQRHTLLAAVLGWMLDAFDVMLYALVLTHIMRDLGMSKAGGGLLGTLTLLASGAGGMLFGYIADRMGRRRALMFSILTYSLFSFACGLATSILMLAIFRFLLGLGMGGEWNTGATLVAETWPTELRAKALAAVQSSWAIGYAGAALVTWAVLRAYPWRVVFFVGVLPALVTLWIRADVPESQMWRERRAASEAGQGAAWSQLLSPGYAKRTLALLLVNFFTLFAWWGLFQWVPSYLSLPASQGGRGIDPARMTTMLVALNLAGMFPGYLSFGWMADRLGRRKSLILYTLLAAALVPIYALARSPTALFWLGIPMAFFGTGYFSGSGLIGSEIFPTSVRAQALGLTYNGARALSSVAPWVIGRAAESRGLGGAFFVCAAAFLLAALTATQLPETRGKILE